MKRTGKVWTILQQAGAALWVCILALVVCFQNTDSIWGNGESWVDASVYKYVAWVMDLGGMPYKDTFDHKGPLVYIFFWIGRQIKEWRGVWVPYTIMMIVTFALLYRVFRKLCSRPVSLLLMVVIFAVSFDYEIANMCPEGMSIPFMCIGLSIFMDYFLFDRISKWRLLCTGAAFGCVLMIKAQMVSVWFVFCIAVLIKCILDKRISKVAFFLAWFLIGCAAVVVPVLIWLAGRGALRDFVDDYIIFNMKYSSSYSGATQLESAVSKAKSMVFFVNKPVVLLCIILCAALIVADKEYRFFHCTYMLYLLVSIVLASLSGRNYGHYGTSLIVAVTGPLAFFFSGRLPDKICSAAVRGDRSGGEAPDDAPLEETLPGSLRSEAASRTRPVTAVVIPAALIACLVCFYASPVLFKKVDKVLDDLNLYVKGETALSSELQGTLDIIYANTDEDDTITVHGLSDILYGKSGRLSASKYSFQHAFAAVDPERNDEYYAELEANPPKLIIQEEADRERMMEFAASHGYRKIASSENGKYTIFKLFAEAEAKAPEWAETLRKTTDFTQYLDELIRLRKEHQVTVYIAVRGTQGDALTVQNADQLAALGFSGADRLLDSDRHTFIGVSSENECCYESIGGNGADHYEGTFYGKNAALISAMEKKGDKSSIRLDEAEYSVDGRGFNIAVYDRESFAVIDSVAFDTDDPAVPCRRW